jgi:hypothetical protein
VKDGETPAGVFGDPVVQLEDVVFKHDDDVSIGDEIFDRPCGEDPVALHHEDEGRGEGNEWSESRRRGGVVCRPEKRKANAQNNKEREK